MFNSIIIVSVTFHLSLAIIYINEGVQRDKQGVYVR